MDKPKNNKLNLKMVFCSAVVLLFLFMINVFSVVNAANRKVEDTEREQENLEESVEEVKEIPTPEYVQIGADRLKKHKGEIYRTEDGMHFFYADSMNFYPACNEHFITHDINEVSYSGVLLCFEGDVNVRSFIYYTEDGKEYFVSEEEKFKFVYDDAQQKWSTYTNAENITSAEGYDPGEWVPLYEYYSIEAYESAHEAYVQEEEKKDNEKIEALKNTDLELDAGGNTVTICSVEGYLPYSNERQGREFRYFAAYEVGEKVEEPKVVVMGKADSYKDIYEGNHEKVLDFRYSIKDSIEDKITGYKHGDTYQVFRTIKTEEVDSAGNEIVVLDILNYEKWFSNNEAGRELFIEIDNYVLEHGCSLQEACDALEIEYVPEKMTPSYKEAQREYYKKLDNGKYLCLTIENFDVYEERRRHEMMKEYENSDNYDEMFNEIYGNPVPNDEFLRYLEDDCFIYE